MLYLAIMEGLGPDGDAAQIDGFLESGRDPQRLKLLKGKASQLEGSQVTALLGQGIQGVTVRVDQLRNIRT